jgi:hypothetical protein
MNVELYVFLKKNAALLLLEKTPKKTGFEEYQPFVI